MIKEVPLNPDGSLNTTTQETPTDTAVIVVASYHDGFCTVKLFDPTSLDPQEIASATVKLKDGKGLARATAEAMETLENKAGK